MSNQSAPKPSSCDELLGLDVGLKRIGVARMNMTAQIPQPLQTLAVGERTVEDICDIAKREQSDLIIVGIPLTMSGQDSEQTLHTRRFADTLYAAGLQVALQDESLSTVDAQAMLSTGEYPKNLSGGTPSDDELAACMILNRYLNTIKNSNQQS